MRKILISIVIFILLIFLFFFGLKFYLRSYTNHGKTVIVPEVVDLYIDEGIAQLKNNGFSYEITDTVYDNKFGKGKIVEQSPVGNSNAKQSRKIFIKINSLEDEMIILPNIIDMQFRDALNKLLNSGFTVTKIKYENDDEGNTINRVMKILYKNKEIKPGERIKKYAELIIVLSQNNSENITVVPNVIGCTYEEVSDRLFEKYLNKGTVKFDNTIKSRRDSLKARVYKQKPNADTIKEVNFGSNIDIWLSSNEKLL
ncbi:MAG: PASTA domain-containing protein [Bacteroidales bacterium]|jgi:beta-lactam-binding protein with PASTA domain|nr:PASTA domain-containing protein [Bacteroidales bacterium]